jgi:hypothetical protein
MSTNILQSLLRQYPIGTPERFVATYGMGFESQPLPGRYPRRPARECYSNTWQQVQKDSGLIYVEGFALAATAPRSPVHMHAWAVDAQGRVIETTSNWADYASGTIYFGVPFSVPFVSEIYSRQARYGILAFQQKLITEPPPVQEYAHPVFWSVLENLNPAGE